jgi:hypothetical protein
MRYQHIHLYLPKFVSWHVLHAGFFNKDSELAAIQQLEL